MIVNWGFRLLAELLSLYGLLLLIRLVMSWIIGSVPTHKIAEIIYGLTDPYLNKFRNIHFLRIGPLDFSAALAIYLVYTASRIFRGFSYGRAVSGGSILVSFLGFVYQLADFMLTLLILLMIIRIIASFFSRGESSSLLFYQVDEKIREWISPLIQIFYKGAVSPMLLPVFALFGLWGLKWSFRIVFSFVAAHLLG